MPATTPSPSSSPPSNPSQPNPSAKVKKPSTRHFQLATIFAGGAILCAVAVLPAACAAAPVQAICYACAAVFLTFAAQVHGEAYRTNRAAEIRRRRLSL